MAIETRVPGHPAAAAAIVAWVTHWVRSSPLMAASEACMLLHRVLLLVVAGSMLLLVRQEAPFVVALQGRQQQQYHVRQAKLHSRTHQGKPYFSCICPRLGQVLDPGPNLVVLLSWALAATP